MTHLEKLESQSIYIIREAYCKLKNLGILWSVGKDSNVLLWLIKKAFFGRVPFKVILLDTGNELDEVYKFRDHYIKEWKLNYLNAECPPFDETDISLPPKARAAARKTLGLKKVIKDQKFNGVFLGIRRDEQPLRGKERYFSPRDENGNWDYKDQPPEFWGYQLDIPQNVHLRIHPLLDWTELDIWCYIEKNKIPIVPLYFSKNGKRYRSLGEKDITNPVDSSASNIGEIIEELKGTSIPERAGRSMDNETEDAFEKLRTEGYM